MKLSEFKSKLSEVNEINFQLENGTVIPSHFHLTEVGKIQKHFIDCGGTVRIENKINFQLWSSIDLDHRLKAEKFRNIISISEEKLNLSDEEIEVEYQNETIGKYSLEFNNGQFILTNQFTDCLASDKCGVPEKKKVKLSELSAQNSNACCTPGSSCC